MNNIWEKLIAPNETIPVKKLMNDEDSKLTMLKSLGQRFLNSNEIFTVDSMGQILLMIANAPFVKSEEECVQVSHIINWSINKTDILPLVSEHNGKDLAYRCFISLGFFHSAMEERTKRYGTPTTNFYRYVGKNTFNKIGYEEISEDFINWEYYLSEMKY